MIYDRICYYDYVIILLNMIKSNWIALYFIAMMTAINEDNSTYNT